MITLIFAVHTSLQVRFQETVSNVLSQFNLTSVEQVSSKVTQKSGFSAEGHSLWKGEGTDRLLFRADWRLRDRNEGLLDDWDRFAKRSFTSIPSPFASQTPSGNALGEKVLVNASKNGQVFSVMGFSKEAYLHVQFGSTLPSQRQGTETVNLSDEDLRKLEGATRWIWASVGAETMSSQPVSVGHLTISGLRARSGALLGNVQEWATKKGWAYRMDNNSATATVGDKVVIPLASPQVRIGEDWKDLPHVTPVVGTDPYLPVSVLEAL